MARRGMNPAKLKISDYRPARITVATMVHIPNFVGYYEHRFAVLRACLRSIIQNTTVEHDLLVLDNGSAPEVERYLESLLREGAVQFLIRCRANVGKLAGLRMIFNATPGELVAYSDDDFYFFPGWLEKQLEIMDAYPNVGAVSGYAVPRFFDPDRIGSTLRFAKSDPDAHLNQGALLRRDWVRDWAVSTGRDPDAAAQEIDQMPQYQISYRGIKALAAANHDQFLAPRKVVMEALPAVWPERLMGGMIEMDHAIDAAGYLRLTTLERTTQHLGNVIDERIVQSIPEIGRLAESDGMPLESSGPVLKRFVSWPPVRAVLLAIYSRLFRLVHPE